MSRLYRSSKSHLRGYHWEERNRVDAERYHERGAGWLVSNESESASVGGYRVEGPREVHAWYLDNPSTHVTITAAKRWVEKQVREASR